MEKDMKLRKFIATTIREFLNEGVETLEDRLKTKLLSIGGNDVKLGLDSEEEQNRMLNEELNQNTNIITAYHRSQKKINSFDISNVSVDSNRQRYGYGLYFSDSIPHNQYGEYLYKVNLFKNKKVYVLIDTKKTVEENIVNKIVEALNDYNKKTDEVVKFSYNGWLFYKTISRILGGDKYASFFLYKNGIDGLKSNISKNWNDYILFNDDDITIEDVKYDPY